MLHSGCGDMEYEDNESQLVVFCVIRLLRLSH